MISSSISAAWNERHSLRQVTALTSWIDRRKRRMQREMKPEGHTISAVQRKVETAMNESDVDYNRLYGDLCRKLLSTPVGEIFPVAVPEVSTNHVTSTTGSTSPNNIHPAFPTFETMASTQLRYLTNFYHPNGLMMTSESLPQGSTQKSDKSVHSLSGATSQEESDLTKSLLSVSGTSEYIDDMDNIDVQKLVDEFKNALERYGVSQRFAARFIMHDTSQGNLSFLMEKGRVKKWEELSPRGKIPYLKMKTWLESKDQQLMTLDALKHSQEWRKNTSREVYNRRERFTMLQLNVLCRLFEENSNPPMIIRDTVAERLGIPLERVNVWFQNQRARGFPARKILQQSLYDNGADSSLDISDVENIKEKKSEENVLNEFRGNQNEGTQSNEHLPTCMPGSHLSTGPDLQVKAEPGIKSFPLDLSTAPNFEVRSSKSVSSVSKQPTAAEMSFEPRGSDGPNHFDNTKHDFVNTNTCPIYSNTTGVATGAAKRKRGSKFQFSSANKIETHDATNIFGMDSVTKRRKLEEMQASGSNYTYLFEMSNNSPVTSNKNNLIPSDYEYIIKSETSADCDILISSQLNDKSSKGSVEHEHMRSSDENETETDLHSNIDSIRRNDETEQLIDKSSKIEELPTKSVELFKAMCASLAVTEEDSKDVHVKEPELD